jgi:uncharacterized DUF497 family protein
MGLLPEFFARVTGFDWDAGNSEKNWRRHAVTQAETEQAFINRPVLVMSSPQSPASEVRHFALGQSDQGRRLAIIFTLRGSLLRVISARPMSRRERRLYAQVETS